MKLYKNKTTTIFILFSFLFIAIFLYLTFYPSYKNIKKNLLYEYKMGNNKKKISCSINLSEFKLSDGSKLSINRPIYHEYDTEIYLEKVKNLENIYYFTFKLKTSWNVNKGKILLFQEKIDKKKTLEYLDVKATDNFGKDVIGEIFLVEDNNECNVLIWEKSMLESKKITFTFTNLKTLEYNLK